MFENQTTNITQKILLIPDLEIMIGRNRITLRRWWLTGKFPRPVKLNGTTSAPHGRVLKSDTIVGKNYLHEQEIKTLERTVSAFFDYIEGIIERRNTFTMKQFALCWTIF